MFIRPDASFPLLASDQADVIRIFLELMSKGEGAGRAPDATKNDTVDSRNDCDDSPIPRELLDFDWKGDLQPDAGSRIRRSGANGGSA
jgi:hypothetical protein